MKIGYCYFSDEILKSEIITSGKKDICDFCKKYEFIYDTEVDKYLENFFNEFVDIFTPVESIPGFPMEDGILLKTEIATNWNIFTEKNDKEIYKIITDICRDKFKQRPEIFNLPVTIGKLNDVEYVKRHSLLKNDWEDFVDDIKYNNRFHTNHVNKRLLEKYCAAILKTYEAGMIFYRCRIINDTKTKISFQEIGAPPRDSATDGRANSRGISRLYLSSSEKTTLHETRAGLYDSVAIGKFKLKKKMIVVDLKKINQISPFQEDIFDNIVELAINKKHFKKIDAEMGKVMRKNDDTLDYLATQYIADFVKSIVSKDDKNEKNLYDGIEFRSVMDSNGYNLAIFDPSIFEVECIENKNVCHISYEYE